jgi:hypothetical protein
MPIVRRAQKFNPDGTDHGVGSWFAIADSKNRGASATKNGGGSWFPQGNGATIENNHGRDRLIAGIKGSEGYERNHPDAFGWKIPKTTSHGTARRAASAHIAKIPLPLARHIAKAWHP